MKKQEIKQNRIEELAEALRRGQARFAAIMADIEGSGSRQSLPSFEVDEIYDIMPGGSLKRMPADYSGTQLHLQDDSDEKGGPAHRPGQPVSQSGRIAAGDNLDYMSWLLREKKMAGQIQLIYVDPPFFTGAQYLASVQIVGRDGKKSPVLKAGAYEDKWGHDLGAYLEMLAVRFYLMRELLSDTGCLWVHLDWHGSHYVKMMLDEIFGHDLFVNEVAWTYKSGGASKRSFAKKHDTLLFYAKTKDYKFHQLKEKSYNRQFKPYHFKGVEEYEDELGWYTMVSMKDVWSIDMVGRTSAERMGYATQKPEKLLERIIEACTDPGDLCADFFAGTGTLGAVCARRGRRWILCDEGDAAISAQILRMADLAGDRDAADKSAGAGKTPGSAAGGAFVVERPIRTKEVRPEASIKVVERDGYLMLERYTADLSRVQERDRQIVAHYINENSLDLISFWSIDTHYDGRIHTGRRLLPGNDIFPMQQREKAEEGDGKTGDTFLHIVGYDLFGSRFEWTGRPGKEKEGRDS